MTTSASPGSSLIKCAPELISMGEGSFEFISIVIKYLILKESRVRASLQYLRYMLLSAVLHRLFIS